MRTIAQVKALYETALAAEKKDVAGFDELHDLFVRYKNMTAPSEIILLVKDWMALLDELDQLGSHAKHNRS